MAKVRVRLSKRKMTRLLQLLDDARTLQRLVADLEHEANDLLGGEHMDWVMEYTSNKPDLPFGAWCERAGIGYTEHWKTLRTLRRRPSTEKA